MAEEQEGEQEQEQEGGFEQTLQEPTLQPLPLEPLQIWRDARFPCVH